MRVYVGGWADLVRAREEREAPATEAPRKEPRERPTQKAKRSGPDPLGVLEAEIEEKEREVATLEQKLAIDWSDGETIDAHARAREELTGLFERWERLLEEVPGPQS